MMNKDFFISNGGIIQAQKLFLKGRTRLRELTGKLGPDPVHLRPDPHQTTATFYLPVVATSSPVAVVVLLVSVVAVLGVLNNKQILISISNIKCTFVLHKSEFAKLNGSIKRVPKYADLRLRPAYIVISKICIGLTKTAN